MENETPNVIIENPKIRRVLYTSFGVIGIVLSATSVGVALAITEGALTTFPLWLVIANAIYPVLGAGFGYTAGKNVPR